MKILRISLLLPAALLIVEHAMIPPKPVVKDAVAAQAEPFSLHLFSSRIPKFEGVTP